MKEQIIKELESLLEGIKSGQFIVIDAELTHEPQGVETLQHPSAPIKTYINKQTVSLLVKWQANVNR